MSRETTETRFDANQADQAWRGHYQHCARCGRAVRTRQWQDCCGDGWALRQDQLAKARALAQARKLDKLPSPDRASLF